MSNYELEAHFLRLKKNALAKIQASKDKWQSVWQEAEGNSAAEATLIHLNLEIQLSEAWTLKELAELEEKVKRAGEEDGAAGDMGK